MLQKTAYEFEDVEGVAQCKEPIPFVPEEGKQYRLLIDDEEFICTGASFSLPDAPAFGTIVYVGNGLLFGLEDTGEPFTIAYNKDHPEDGTLIAHQEVAEHTVQIFSYNEIAKKLDEKYLPGVLKNTKASGVTFNLTLADDGTISADMPVAEIAEHVSNGIPVTAVYKHKFFPLTAKGITSSERPHLTFSGLSEFDRLFNFVGYINSSGTKDVWEGSGRYFSVPALELSSESNGAFVMAGTSNYYWTKNLPNIRLYSSTSGSKKVFSIAVDDSGTLTATEVTD